MKRTSFESMPCPLARAADVLGDSWNLLVLREAFYGHTRFDEFESRLGIATNTLTRRLAALVQAGLLEKRAYSERPARHEYVLTQRGHDFRPVMLTLLAWGTKHAMPPGSPVRLVDSITEQPVQLDLVDARTGRRIGPRHKVWRRGSRSTRPGYSAFDGSL